MTVDCSNPINTGVLGLVGLNRLFHMELWYFWVSLQAPRMCSFSSCSSSAVAD